MNFVLSQSFTFDAAHTLHRTVPLPKYQGSKRIHGHTYTATVFVQGQRGAAGMTQVRKPGKKLAWMNVDLFYLREQIERVRSLLDHHFLDEVDGLGAPTLENLCVFIAAQMSLPVHSVMVSRASGDACTYSPTKEAA